MVLVLGTLYVILRLPKVETLTVFPSDRTARYRTFIRPIALRLLNASNPVKNHNARIPHSIFRDCSSGGKKRTHDVTH